MQYLFDQDDERAVLEGLARNQHKAELISQVHEQRGQTRQAANWAKAAQRVAFKIELLAGIFKHKN